MGRPTTDWPWLGARRCRPGPKGQCSRRRGRRSRASGPRAQGPTNGLRAVEPCDQPYVEHGVALPAPCPASKTRGWAGPGWAGPGLAGPSWATRAPRAAAQTDQRRAILRARRGDVVAAVGTSREGRGCLRPATAIFVGAEVPCGGISRICLASHRRARCGAVGGGDPRQNTVPRAPPATRAARAASWWRRASQRSPQRSRRLALGLAPRPRGQGRAARARLIWDLGGPRPHGASRARPGQARPGQARQGPAWAAWRGRPGAGGLPGVARRVTRPRAGPCHPPASLAAGRWRARHSLHPRGMSTCAPPASAGRPMAVLLCGAVRYVVLLGAGRGRHRGPYGRRRGTGGQQWQGRARPPLSTRGGMRSRACCCCCFCCCCCCCCEGRQDASASGPDLARRGAPTLPHRAPRDFKASLGVVVARPALPRPEEILCSALLLPASLPCDALARLGLALVSGSLGPLARLAAWPRPPGWPCVPLPPLLPARSLR